MRGSPTGYRVAPTSFVNLEAKAWRLRRALIPNAPVTSPLPGLELFSRLDLYKVQASGREIGLMEASCPDAQAGTAEGMTFYDPDEDKIVVLLPDRTYASLERGEFRARFTLPHELGHAVLHTELLVKLRAIPHHLLVLQRQEPHKWFEDSEWQANAFAGALLMPAVGLAHLEESQGDLTPTLVADVFSVSRESAGHRLSNYSPRREELVRVCR